MKRNFYTFLFCLITATAAQQALAQGGVYFREGFEADNGWPTTALDATPMKAVTTPNGTFYTYGAYRTTGATGACATQTGGASHLRFANLTSVVSGYTAADSAYLLTPLVDMGIFDLFFYNGRAARRFTIYKTTEVDPATTNWVEVAHLTNTNTACQEFTVAVNDPAARRLKIVARSGTDSDIDSLVMRSIGVLPMRMGDVRLQERGGLVQVEWTAYNERSVRNYQVQRSTDGLNFSTIGTVGANNRALNEYSFTDSRPSQGMLYYRIKGIDLDARETTSKVVRVNVGANYGKSFRAVNPSVNGKIELQLSQLPAGTYSITVTAASGQVVARRAVQMNGAQLSTVIDLSASAPRGLYVVNLEGAGSKLQTKVMME